MSGEAGFGGWLCCCLHGNFKVGMRVVRPVSSHGKGASCSCMLLHQVKVFDFHVNVGWK